MKNFEKDYVKTCFDSMTTKKAVFMKELEEAIRVTVEVSLEIMADSGVTYRVVHTEAPRTPYKGFQYDLEEVVSRINVELHPYFLIKACNSISSADKLLIHIQSNPEN